MVLRLDLTRQDRQHYLADLAAAGIAARAVDWAPAAVRLEEPVAVSALPGFPEGRVSIQDAGAQLAAPLLAAEPGMRVLDACAAPGGKTGHLLEHTPGLAELVAADIDPQRVARIEENLRRLNRSASLVVADMRRPASFWDGKPFDRILLDAPCSSTGVIRRHPDIKLLRRTDDIQVLAAAQLEILRAAFGMLAVGGRCSIRPVPCFLTRTRRSSSGFWRRNRPHAPYRFLPGSRLRPGHSSGVRGCSFCQERRREPMGSIMLVSKRQRSESKRLSLVQTPPHGLSLHSCYAAPQHRPIQEGPPPAPAGMGFPAPCHVERVRFRGCARRSARGPLRLREYR